MTRTLLTKPVSAILLSLVCLASTAGPPSREAVLKEMAVPSTEKVRGQKDGTGFARTREQMDEAWTLSGLPPSPACFGGELPQKAMAVIVPHDDYVYAGRIYRDLVPLVKARTVVLVGPLHRWREFGIRDKVVFDGYSSWRTPDGEIKVSGIRDVIIRGLAPQSFVVDNTAFDSEHSIEGPLYWLKRSNPEAEIVPILVPPMDYQRMQELLYDVGMVLGNHMEFNGLSVGTDVAFIMSADAVHYGEDFGYVPYGSGGVEAYVKAVEADKEIMKSLLSRTVNPKRVTAIFGRFQDPMAPDASKITWCGRFSIPFGLGLASQLFKGLNAKGKPGLAFYGHPYAYSTSIGSPALPSKTGLGVTAPSDLFHFVGYPGMYYVEAVVSPLEQNREIAN